MCCLQKTSACPLSNTDKNLHILPPTLLLYVTKLTTRHINESSASLRSVTKPRVFSVTKFDFNQWSPCTCSTIAPTPYYIQLFWPDCRLIACEPVSLVLLGSYYLLPVDYWETCCYSLVMLSQVKTVGYVSL